MELGLVEVDWRSIAAALKAFYWFAEGEFRLYVDAKAQVDPEDGKDLIADVTRETKVTPACYPTVGFGRRHFL